ncbi:MAG: DUF1552 domain-containing protein [bacterium]
MVIRTLRPHRRAILRGLLGGAAVTVGLPLLEIFGDGRAHAAGGGFPKRFGMFFWGNGTQPDRWNPADTGPGYRLSEQLAPLGDLSAHVTVVSGTRVTVPNDAPMAPALPACSAARASSRGPAATPTPPPPSTR